MAAKSRKVTPKKRTKSAKRSAAGKKAAATRKRKAAVRSAAARKGARTRARRSGTTRRSNPTRRKRSAKRSVRRASPRRRAVAKRTRSRVSNPSRRRKSTSRKRRRVSNPTTVRGFLQNLVKGVQDAGKAAVVVLPTLALKNAIGGIKVKAADGVTEVTLAEKVGPLYDIIGATAALALIPPVLPKVGLGKFAEQGRWGLRILWLLTAAKTVAFYARHGWKADQAVLAGDAYPTWTDLLDVGSKSLQGNAAYYGGQFVGGRQPLNGLPPGQAWGNMGSYPYVSNQAVEGQFAYRQ